MIARVHADLLKEKELLFEEKFVSIVTHLNSEQRRSLQHVKDAKMSSCLNVLPVVRHNFDLSAIFLAISHKHLKTQVSKQVGITTNIKDNRDILKEVSIHSHALFATTVYCKAFSLLDEDG